MTGSSRQWARRRGPGLGRTPRLALLLALAVLLTACGQLPESGPVHVGRTEAPAAGAVQFAASRPGVGDSPTEIVQGFIAAGVAGLSGDGDFEVARSFLTSGASTSWTPLSEVVVAANDEPQTFQPTVDTGGGEAGGGDGGEAGPGAGPGAGSGEGSDESGDPDEGEPSAAPSQEDLESADRVVVQAGVVAVGDVDSAGVYTASTSRVSSELAYGLTRVAGEWRIDTLPEGLLMTEVQFSVVFRAVALQFLTPDGTTFVPDVRYVPVRNAASHAVELLLAGPTDWLAPAVVSRIPNGLTIEAGRGVSSSDAGVVEVHLSPTTAPQEQRDALYAQVRTTLMTMSGVRDVTLWLGAAPYEPALDAQLPRAAPVPPDQLLAVSDGALVTVTATGVVPYPSAEAGVTGVRSPVPGYAEGDGVAALRGEDLVLVAPDGVETSLASAPDPLPPTRDTAGWIWSGTRDGALFAVRADGTRVEVAAEDLAGSRVQQVRLARDGARAVVLLTDSTGLARLRAAAVLRDDTGAPVALLPGPTLATFATGYGVAWTDSTTVALLAASDVPGAAIVRSVTIGGPMTALSSTAQAVSIAAGNGMSQLYVATAEGRLMARVSLRWEEVATGVSDPSFAG